MITFVRKGSSPFDKVIKISVRAKTPSVRVIPFLGVDFSFKKKTFRMLTLALLSLRAGFRAGRICPYTDSEINRILNGLDLS